MTHVERILKDGNKAPPLEHIEDRDSRVAAVAYGRKREADVLEKLGLILAKLVTTYSDNAAREALEALREDFWSDDPRALPAAPSGSKAGEP